MASPESLAETILNFLMQTREPPYVPSYISLKPPQTKGRSFRWRAPVNSICDSGRSTGDVHILWSLRKVRSKAILLRGSSSRTYDRLSGMGTLVYGKAAPCQGTRSPGPHHWPQDSRRIPRISFSRERQTVGEETGAMTCPTESAPERNLPRSATLAPQ